MIPITTGADPSACSPSRSGRHDHGAKVVVRAMMDAGFEVIYTGLRQTPEQVAPSRRKEDVDVIALSSLAGSHPVLPALKPLLEQAGLSDKLWMIGGNLPAGPLMTTCAALGFAGIFRPSSAR